MLSLEVYKFLHIVGFAVLLLSLGAYSAQMLTGRSRDFTHRKILTVGHGVAMMVMLVAGFGMLARLGLVKEWPLWVIIKLVVFLGMGAIIGVMRRKAEWNAWLWVVVLGLSGVAAWAALFKPA